MNRIKVINEPADLVSILRAVDTEVKRNVFKEVATGWKTVREIGKKFGEDGRNALQFFEKIKLVESRWQSTNGEPEKAYHSYYVSFHINTSCPVYEISDVLSAAVMPEEEFERFEEGIFKSVEKEGKFAGDIADELGISTTMLKSIIRRSIKLEYRGHRIEIYKE
jgi:predicted DNA-binding ArsR family transcriptional regulator